MPDNEENINENENQNESSSNDGNNQVASSNDGNNQVASSNDGNNQVASSNDGNNQVASSNDGNDQVAPSNDYIYDEETHQWRLRTENDPEPSDVELIILEGTDVTDGINRASDRITAAVNENLDVRSREILSAFGAAQKNSLKEEIIAEVIERLKPEGHVYPDTSLYPEWMTPMLNIAAQAYYGGGFSYTDQDVESQDAMFVAPAGINGHGGYDVNFIYALEHLDVSKFQNLSKLFKSHFFMSAECQNLELDLSGWDVSHVKYFYKMFEYDYGVNRYLGKLDLSNWDVRAATSFKKMFGRSDGSSSNGTAYPLYIGELDVSGWDVTNITDMSSMFECVSTPVLDLSTWDLSYVSNLYNFINPAGNRNTASSVTAFSTSIDKVLWGGACSANLNLSGTYLNPANAELFFQSLSSKIVNGTVTITMPSSAQGADISIATNKGYTIAGITAP